MTTEKGVCHVQVPQRRPRKHFLWLIDLIAPLCYTLWSQFDKTEFSEEKMIIREYQPFDCGETADLFYNTVHTVNANDYTDEQLTAWATGKIDIKQWNRSLLEHFSVVAVEAGIIIGFGDIDSTGYLDRLYVHKDYQRKGVATAICQTLEQSVKGKIITHASITARPFFENRGYTVISEQQVERQSVFLTNFVMEKNR